MRLAKWIDRCKTLDAMLNLTIFVLLSAVLNPGVQKEPLDRIVAVVENYLITLSDIRNEKAIREVLGEPPRHNNRELLDDLIRQRLIHAQVDEDPDTEPAPADVEKQLRQITDLKGLSIEAVREAVRERLRVERLLTDRFDKSVPEFTAWVERLKEMANIEIFDGEP
jgi:DNA-binding transcriptional ArsR family regulator